MFYTISFPLFFNILPSSLIQIFFYFFDTVSRAEFGTILSRALWGDEHDGGTPYYAAHLNALKKAGIMTQIEDPVNRKEIRGYVMLMLMRADEDGVIGTPAICKDPMTLLLCAMDDEGCPAICKDKEEVGPDISVKSGDLAVSVSDYSAKELYAPKNGTLVFNTLKFKASETIKVASVTIERIGLTSSSTISSIWLERDGVQVSNPRSLNSKGQAVLTIKQGMDVKSTENLDLVVALSGTAGSLAQLKIADVNSSAKNLNITEELTTLYKLTDYEVANIKLAKVASAGDTYQVKQDDSYIFGEFSVTAERTITDNEVRDVALNSIEFYQDGGFDLRNLKDIKVYRDSKVVSKSVEFTKYGIIIYFGGNFIEGGKKANYTVMAEVATMDKEAENVNLFINKKSAVVAQEVATKFRTDNNVNEDASPAVEIDLGDYILKGGTIKFKTADNFPNTVNAGEGYQGVVLAEGTLEVVEPIELGTSVLTLTDAKVTTKKSPIENLYLEIAGVSYDARVKLVAGEATYTFDSGIEVNKTSKVRLLADISSEYEGALDGTFKLMNSTPAQSINSDMFSVIKYVSTNKKVEEFPTGKIKIAELKIQLQEFSLSNSASKVTTLADDADGALIFDGELLSTESDVRLQSIVIIGTMANPASTVRVWVEIGKTSTAVREISHGGAGTTFGGVLGTLVKNEKTPIKIYVDSVNGIEGTIRLQVQLKGLNSSSNQVETNTQSSAILDIVGDSTISILPSASDNLLILEGQPATLATFRINVKNGSANLTSLEMSSDVIPVGSTVKLRIEGINKEFTAKETATPGIYEFKNGSSAISETLKVGTYMATISIDAVDLDDMYVCSDGVTDNKTDCEAVPAIWYLHNVWTLYDISLDGGTTRETLNKESTFVKGYPLLAKKGNGLIIEPTITYTKGPIGSVMKVLWIDFVGDADITKPTGPFNLTLNETRTLEFTINSGKTARVGGIGYEVDGVYFELYPNYDQRGPFSWQE